MKILEVFRYIASGRQIAGWYHDLYIVVDQQARLKLQTKIITLKTEATYLGDQSPVETNKVNIS